MEKNSEIGSILTRAFEECGDKDYGYIYELNERFDSYEAAFRIAVANKKFAYVEENAKKIELNDGYADGFNYSTYLYETEDIQMKELLIRFGAKKSPEEYADYKFAMDRSGGCIMAFDEAFRKTVLNDYLNYFAMTEYEAAELLARGDGCALIEDACGCVRRLEEDLAALGLYPDGDELALEEIPEDGGEKLYEILNDLIGYDISFEGDVSGVNTGDICFIE